MKKRRFSLLGVALAALALIVVLLFSRMSMERSHKVELAETDSTQDGDDKYARANREAIRRVEVTPQTVRFVVERLARPENYSRSVTVERFWNGGSGVTEIAARVASGWTRVDVTDENGTQRHVITGEGKSWIWYNDSKKVFSAASVLEADEEQSIPTYEDVLRREPASIAAADYRKLDELSCIYVETVADEMGYVERDWVSVESGLLVASERELNGELVYRMTALSSESGSVTTEAFALPDGTALFDPDSTEKDDD